MCISRSLPLNGRVGDCRSSIFRTGWDTDTVNDFTTKGKQHDIVDLSGLVAVKNFDDLMKNHISMHNGDAWIEGPGGDLLILVDTKIKDLSKGDFDF